MNELEIFVWIFFILFFVIPGVLCWKYCDNSTSGFQLYPHSPRFKSPPDQDYYYSDINATRARYEKMLDSFTPAERDLYYNYPEDFKRMFGWYPSYYKK